ncbi:uncharacterized protein LOC134830360 [Culicoides brevitarsis]|uniref:uncharacterized protein LOC134830360 n=1 Tax=Culicoides brevitarsis TaxID=469753 RepID=UPI00307C90EA
MNQDEQLELLKQHLNNDIQCRKLIENAKKAFPGPECFVKSDNFFQDLPYRPSPLPKMKSFWERDMLEERQKKNLLTTDEAKMMMRCKVPGCKNKVYASKKTLTKHIKDHHPDYYKTYGVH